MVGKNRARGLADVTLDSSSRTIVGEYLMFSGTGQNGAVKFGNYRPIPGAALTAQIVARREGGIATSIRLEAYYYDAFRNQIDKSVAGTYAGTSDTKITLTFTPPNGTYLVQVWLWSTNATCYFKPNTFQLEYGTAASAYEPYVESIAHAWTPYSLKRVGAVCDDTDLLNGVHTRRCPTDWASLADTVYASYDGATYTNVDVVKTTAFTAAVAGTTGVDLNTIYRDKNGIPLTEVAAANIDETASVGKYYYHTDKTVWIIVAKGAYADIATARTGLGTSTLLYQLSTPVVTQLRWHLANAYQGGSLIVEPVIMGSRKPNAVTNKLDITDANLPASSIEQVLRHDVQTNGVLVETDVTASCTLDAGGMAITVTGVDAAKVYTYRCIADSRYNPGCDVVTRVPLSCARHDYGAAATAWTLTTDEANAEVLVCTNAGGAADIIAPAIVRAYTVVNASGQNITIKKSGGTGVTLGTGKSARVIYNGTDYAFVLSSNA